MKKSSFNARPYRWLRAPLTDRQEQVLLLLVAGWSSQQICTKLGIKRGAYRSHISQALNKFGVDSVRQMILLSWLDALFDETVLLQLLIEALGDEETQRRTLCRKVRSSQQGRLLE